MGLCACGSSLEGDDGTEGGPPPYQNGMQGAAASAGTSGSLPGGNNGNVPGNGSSGNGSNTTDGRSNGVNPGLSNGAGGAGSNPAAGAGGSAMGTAGGAMMASGGSSSGMGGSASNPPVDVPAGDGSCGAAALFCENFERLAAGALPTNAPWAIDTGGGGALDIDATTARGTRSLHIRASSNGSGFIRVNGFRPPGNSFFGRVQLRVDAFPTNPNFAHFVLVEATGGGGGLVRPVGGQYIAGEGATALWGVGNDRSSSGDWTSWQPSAPAVSGRWICYEWQMRAADANIDVWLDGVAQPALSVSSTMRRGYNGAPFSFPTFDSIRFGWALFQANGDTRDVWLDDIAIDTQRIGCGQ